MELFRDGKYDVGGDRLHIGIQRPDIESIIDQGFKVIRFAENTFPNRYVKGWDPMDKVSTSLEDIRFIPEPEITTDGGGDIFINLPNNEKLKDYPRVIEFPVEGEQMEQLAVRGLQKVLLHNLPDVGHELFPGPTVHNDRI